MGERFRGAGGLARAGVLRSPGAGRVAAALSVALLALLAAAAAAVVPGILDRTAAGDDLTRQELVGARGPTCQRVVVLLDQSGSMTDYAQVRVDAMETLAGWAPANLRGDDQIAVVDWADSAAVRTAPTDVRALAQWDPTANASNVGGGTSVMPAVEQAAGLDDTGCRTTLVFISDGQVADGSTTRLNEMLRDAGIDGVSLVLPNATPVPDHWMSLFPYSKTFQADPLNPGQTARALGQAVASATGQQLEIFQ